MRVSSDQYLGGWGNAAAKDSATSGNKVANKPPAAPPSQRLLHRSKIPPPKRQVRSELCKRSSVNGFAATCCRIG